MAISVVVTDDPLRNSFDRCRFKRKFLHCAGHGSPLALLLERYDRDRIEVGHAVGLGPQRDPAGIRKGWVVGLKERLAVKRDGEAVSFRLQRQRVPLVRRHLGIGAGQLFAFAFDDPVKAHIVFKRIGPGYIVIIRRRQPHDDAAGLIDRPRYGFEAHGQFQVFT